MVCLNAMTLLEKSGHTKYWLYKQLGMSYQNFMRMMNNATKSICYENIDALCQLLECTPMNYFYSKMNKIHVDFLCHTRLGSPFGTAPPEGEPRRCGVS